MYHQMRKERKKKGRFAEPPIPKEGFKVDFDWHFTMYGNIFVRVS